MAKPSDYVQMEATEDTKKLMQALMSAGVVSSEADAETTVDLIVGTIPRALKNADKMEFAGIGKFSTHKEGDFKKVDFTADPNMLS